MASTEEAKKRNYDTSFFSLMTDSGGTLPSLSGRRI